MRLGLFGLVLYISTYMKNGCWKCLLVLWDGLIVLVLLWSRLLGPGLMFIKYAFWMLVCGVQNASDSIIICSVIGAYAYLYYVWLHIDYGFLLNLLSVGMSFGGCTIQMCGRIFCCKNL